MYISSLEKSNLVHYPVSFCFGKWGCCSLTPTARDWEQRRTDKFIGGQPNPPFHFQPLPPALKNCLYFLEETFIWNCVFNLVLFIFYNWNHNKLKSYFDWVQGGRRQSIPKMTLKVFKINVWGLPPRILEGGLPATKRSSKTKTSVAGPKDFLGVLSILPKLECSIKEWNYRSQPTAINAMIRSWAELRLMIYDVLSKDDSRFSCLLNAGSGPPPAAAQCSLLMKKEG